MTPVDELGSLDGQQTGNYLGEAKTECLVLCSKLNSMHHQKTPVQGGGIRSVEARPSSVCSRLQVLRSSERLNGPGRNGLMKKAPLPTHLTFPNLRGDSYSMPSHPKLVKVSVYTKAVNPYIVIFDSNRKYAKPAFYLKLVNCTVTSGGEEGKGDDDNNNDEDSCLFRIQPSKQEDTDSSGPIVLRASSTEKRDEWVRFLEDVCNGKGARAQSSAGYVPGSSVLPTLVEQEDDEENNEDDETPTKPVETLKSPSRRKHREGRRSSLNSLGIRLRCYTLGKGR